MRAQAMRDTVKLPLEEGIVWYLLTKERRWAAHHSGCAEMEPERNNEQDFISFGDQTQSVAERLRVDDKISNDRYCCKTHINVMEQRLSPFKHIRQKRRRHKQRHHERQISQP